VTTVTASAPRRKLDFTLHWRGVKACKRCASAHQSEFNGEIAAHFPGLKGLDKSIVWVFPKLLVCLDCGFTEFTIPERELQVLEQGSPVEGAVVLAGRAARASEKVRIESRSSGMNG
jgi:hypothetical protein